MYEMDDLKKANLHVYCFSFKEEYYIFDTLKYYGAKISQKMFRCFEQLIEHRPIEKQRYEKELVDIYKLYERDVFLGKECEQRKEKGSLDDLVVFSFSPVYDCNFKCRYCFGSAGNNYKEYPNFFSKDMVYKLLERIYYHAYCDINNFRIEFVSGGEPFLNFEAIKAAVEYSEEVMIKSKKNINIWLCTNGSIYNEKWIQYLDEHNVRIGISIDGNEKAHNANRLNNENIGTYKTVMGNYYKIKGNASFSNRIKDVWGSSVISDNNYNITSIMEHHLENKFQSVQLKLIWSKDKNKEFIEKLKIQYEKFAFKVMEKYEQNNIDFIRMILNENDTFGKIIRHIILGKKIVRRCRAGREKIAICPNGDIYPCDSFVGNKLMKIGNLFYETEECTKVFKNMCVEERPYCKKCSIRYLCGGDCYYNSYLVNADVAVPDNLFCELNKHLCSLAIWMIIEMKTKNASLFEIICKEVNIKDDYQKNQ